MISLQYEATPNFSRQELLDSLENGDCQDFARALRSAAMFWPLEDFDTVIVKAAQKARTPEEHWAISEAIITIVQARRLVPSVAEAVLGSIPDGDFTSASRDEALSLVQRAKSLEN